MHSRFELMSAKFYVLTALVRGPKSGMEVQAQIIGDTVGGYVRTPTVYAVLRALVRDGLAECDFVRKEYRLTAEGRRILALETKTLRWMLKEALVEV